MGQQVICEVGRQAIVGAAIGDPPAALLNAAKVMLFKVQITPDATMQLDDLTECAFAGYSSSAVVVWKTPLIGPGSFVMVEADSLEFICTGASDETVFGAALVCAADGSPTSPLDTVLAIEAFDNPRPISRAGQGVYYTPHFEYP